MTKSAGSLLFFFLFPLVLSFNIGGHLKFANGREQIPQVAPETWCVAKPSATGEELESNIEYACNVLSNCNLIQPGGSCSSPDTLINHASVVMNQYYALKGRNIWNCYFNNSGLIVITDPSYGSCKYA